MKPQLIGKVTWESCRLKYCVEQVDRKVDSVAPGDFYIGLENVVPWTGKLFETNADTKPEGTSNSFRTGDVLFGKLRPYLAKCIVPGQDGLCSSEMLVLRPRRLRADFLQYVMLSREWIDIVDASTYGAKMPRAGWNFIGNAYFSVPPRGEQCDIADFLDRETARIDELVEKKESLIDKLLRNRQALISRAVTKGPDSLAPLKHSRVEWLGRVPKHWSICSAKYVSSVFVPDRDKPALSESGAVPWFTLDQMSEHSIRLALPKLYMGDEKCSRSLPKGAVLCSCVGSFGLAAVTESECVVNQQIQAFIPGKLMIPEFLAFALTCSKPYFESVATASTIPYVNRYRFGAVPVPLPPREEQKLVVEQLSVQLARSDGLVALVRRAVDRLRDYRTSLISAAVTGQIDVRTYRKEPEAVLEAV